MTNMLADIRKESIRLQERLKRDENALERFNFSISSASSEEEAVTIDSFLAKSKAAATATRMDYTPSTRTKTTTKRRPSTASAAIGRRPSTAKRQAASDTVKLLQERIDRMQRSYHSYESKGYTFLKEYNQIKRVILEEKKIRKQLGGVKASKMLHTQTLKKLSRLEKSASQLRTRVDEAEAKKNELIHEINTLRRATLTFSIGYKKLESDFQSKQLEMADIIAASNIAYNNRESAMQKLDLLKKNASKEKKLFDEEYSKLGEVIEEQTRMDHYVKTSALKRKERELLSLLERGDLTVEEEAKLKLRLEKLQTKVKNYTTNDVLATREQRIESYEQAFTRLKSAARLSDLQQIVDTFVRNEDHSFSLFSYIHRMNQETDKLEEQLKAVSLEVEKYETEQCNDESSKKRMLKEMEGRLEKVNKRNQLYRASNREREETIELLAKATNNLFLRIGCDKVKGLHGFRNNIIDTPTKDQVEGLDSAAAALQYQVDNDNEDEADEADEADDNTPATFLNSKYHIVRKRDSLVSASRRASTRRDRNKRRSLPSSLVIQLGNAVTERNIMLYLGVVEQRTNEIINSYRAKMSGHAQAHDSHSVASSQAGAAPHAHSHKHALFHSGPQFPHVEHTLSINPPATFAESFDGKAAEYDYPLASEDIREVKNRESQSNPELVPIRHKSPGGSPQHSPVHQALRSVDYLAEQYKEHHHHHGASPQQQQQHETDTLFPVHRTTPMNAHFSFKERDREA